MNKKYPAVLTLWIMGYTILAGGFASTLYGFIQQCNGVLSCEVENLFWKTTGFFTLFIGAVLIVLGYAAKSKAELKDNDIL